MTENTFVNCPACRKPTAYFHGGRFYCTNLGCISKVDAICRPSKNSIRNDVEDVMDEVYTSDDNPVIRVFKSLWKKGLERLAR